jgi:hypothetical protein
VQLELGALPVADPALVADVARERWLSDVLEAARASEQRDGAWWTGATLANRMRQPPARVGPALRCLERRGAVERDYLGADPFGHIVWVYRVRR